MAKSGGMGGYRGRRTVTDVLKVIVAILAVVVVLMLAGLWFGQRYIVYTDDGIQLVLPFFQWSLPGLGGEQSGEITFVERPVEEGDGSQALATEPEDTTPATLAIQLPLSALLDGTAAEQLEAAGANTLVVEMKSQEGTLGWVSQQSLADYAHVNGDDPQREEAVKVWNAGEVHTVAVVQCFRDNTVPYYRNSLAVRTATGNWRDELHLRWLDPSNEEVRSYLVSLCGELGQLGFDEILLVECRFPVTGNLENIATKFPEDRAASLEELLTRMKQAVEPYGTQISVLTDSAGAEGGLTGEMLSRCADRVWTADTAAYAAVAGEKLVQVTSALNPESAGAQAVLTE